MSQTPVLAVAPHPDDETLGCGGALLKHIAEGGSVHWLIVTAMTESTGFSPERIRDREAEIAAVAARYGFDSVRSLGFETTRLDSLPMGDVVGRMSEVFRDVEPEVVYMPYRHDVHTDHAVVFDAAAACTKWFRYPSVRRVLAYETLSETEFNLNPDAAGFRPNVFVDVGPYLNEKIAIMGLFKSEVAAPPFPRSEQAIRSLAHLRGAAAGYGAAEAFMLLRERL